MSIYDVCRTWSEKRLEILQSWQHLKFDFDVSPLFAELDEPQMLNHLSTSKSILCQWFSSNISIIIIPMNEEICTIPSKPRIIRVLKMSVRRFEITVASRVCHLIGCNIPCNQWCLCASECSSSNENKCVYTKKGYCARMVSNYIMNPCVKWWRSHWISPKPLNSNYSTNKCRRSFQAYKYEEVPLILLANTIRNPWAMMVKLLNTTVARRAMLGPHRPDYLAGRTKLRPISCPLSRFLWIILK